MGQIRVGTVGFSYRDWVGVFYPQGAPSRRQLGIYCEKFDVCELTQFTHQMPDVDRINHFTSQIKTDVRMLVRIHNTFTHCADIAMALSMARYFRKAIEPLYDAQKFAGFVAPFPYAFKNTPERRDYIRELAAALGFMGLPLQLDFRHPSWATPSALRWISENKLGFVCVDEPSLPGLVPPLSLATSDRVVVRFHGRNAEAWWSGNATTRHDYCYSQDELVDMVERYLPLVHQASEVCFLFQNHWQAQSVRNALQWKNLVTEAAEDRRTTPTIIPVSNSIVEQDELINELEVPEVSVPTEPEQSEEVPSLDDDLTRPPAMLSLSEVKMRVSREFSSLQAALDLPPRAADITPHAE